MSKCADCKYYHLEFDADGFNDEWCKINNIYLHDDDCPNYKGDDRMTEKLKKTDCKYYRESDGNCLNFTYVGEYDPCTDGDLEHCYKKYPHFFEVKE